MSDTIKANGAGRLGNLLFHNFVVSCLAKNYKKSATYQQQKIFTQLGIYFHNEPNPISSDITIQLSDSNLLEYINNFANVTYHFKMIDNTFCQLKEISRLLYSHFRSVQSDIIGANPYKSRYKTNRDVFVHVRLGDISQCSPGLSYFETALNDVDYEKGYLSTDSPESPMVWALCAKYNLELFYKSEVETLQFGSTCSSLILSHGTFSWFLGALGFDSTVRYPVIKQVWHGNIFVIPEWIEVTY